MTGLLWLSLSRAGVKALACRMDHESLKWIGCKLWG